MMMLALNLLYSIAWDQRHGIEDAPGFITRNGKNNFIQKACLKNNGLSFTANILIHLK